MQTNTMPTMNAPADRVAWGRPVLDLLSVDETAIGGGGAPDESGLS